MRGRSTSSALRASFGRPGAAPRVAARDLHAPTALTLCVLEDAAVPFALIDLSADGRRGPRRRAPRDPGARGRDSLRPGAGPAPRVRGAAARPRAARRRRHRPPHRGRRLVLVGAGRGLGGALRRPPPRPSHGAAAGRPLQRLRSRAGRASGRRLVAGDAGLLAEAVLGRDPDPRPARRSASRARCAPSPRGAIDFLVPADLVAQRQARRRGSRARACSPRCSRRTRRWLFRLSGQDDVVVGVPAAGQASTAARPRWPLRADPAAALPGRSATQPFRELLKSVRTAVLDGFEHQQLTFGELLRELPIRRDPVAPAAGLDVLQPRPARARGGARVRRARHAAALRTRATSRPSTCS